MWAGFDADPAAKGYFPPQGNQPSPAQPSRASGPQPLPAQPSSPQPAAWPPSSSWAWEEGRGGEEGKGRRGEGKGGPSVGAPGEGTEEGRTRVEMVSASTLLGCAEGLGAVRGAGPRGAGRSVCSCQEQRCSSPLLGLLFRDLESFSHRNKAQVEAGSLPGPKEPDSAVATAPEPFTLCHCLCWAPAAASETTHPGQLRQGLWWPWQLGQAQGSSHTGYCNAGKECAHVHVCVHVHACLCMCSDISKRGHTYAWSMEQVCWTG